MKKKLIALGGTALFILLTCISFVGYLLTGYAPVLALCCASFLAAHLAVEKF